MSRSAWTGYAAITLAVWFNIPYAVLAVIFDYPAILRRSALDVLARFEAGGAALLLSWYAFALAALALLPLAVSMAITRQRLAARPALAIGAAIAGALAGVTQAIGRFRWVFAVPRLAHEAAKGDPAAAAAAAQAFDMLNAYGGVAVGEHLGQLLTALFVGQVALLQRADSYRRTAVAGFATAAMLTLGTGEGLAMALEQNGGIFSLATIAGFLGLTLWLIASGISLIRRA